MTDTTTSAPIDNLLTETRTFPVDPAFAATANVDAARAAELFAAADADPVAFWEDKARRLSWDRPWDTAYTWRAPEPGPLGHGEPGGTPPEARWFDGGTLNVAVNCVDRHVAAGRGDKVAYYFEGEPGDRRALTYRELQDEVSRAANALTALGVGKGDRVVVYLPVIPETVIITLAIARIGAIHSLVFGGFSAEAVRFRVEDTEAKLLVTTDGQFRRGRAVPVKEAADQAVEGIDSIEHVLVVRRTGSDIPWTPGRDVWWHETVDVASAQHEPEFFDAETPLFIIYTSGTTGKPKGLVHTSGGYLTHASWTHWALFDVRDSDVYWCTADLAWVTAHSYALYGPLSNGVTSVIYEGTPDTPSRTRHLEIIERYGVTIYYTAPTLVRTFMSWWPAGLPAGHDLSSLRLLGSVGEAINPEAWVWFRSQHGRGVTPIVDTWWQSETGAAVMCPLPGADVLKPGSSLRAVPGLKTLVVDDAGSRVPNGSGGFLVVNGTWPGLARTVWRNPQRYYDSYWAKFSRQGYFFSGDGGKYDEDGDIWVLGRVDDVINVSGHRLSTIEIESALVSHPHVAEAGVVGVADDLTGQAIAAFIIPTQRPAADAATPTPAPAADSTADSAGADDSAEEWPHAWVAAGAELADAVRTHVAHEIGPVAKPKHVFVVPELPKTRSGKIMRRLLADIVDGRPLGDATSLQDETAPTRIAAIVEAARPGGN